MCDIARQIRASGLSGVHAELVAVPTRDPKVSVAKRVVEERRAEHRWGAQERGQAPRLPPDSPAFQTQQQQPQKNNKDFLKEKLKCLHHSAFFLKKSIFRT
jgi:hypothetical protein